MSPSGRPGAARAARMWREVADQVFVRRFVDFNVNVGLVVGDDAALVVDTRGSERQGRELAGEIRWITQARLIVANTHHHYDHAFGNSAFLPADMWGHERAPLACDPTAGPRNSPWRRPCPRSPRNTRRRSITPRTRHSATSVSTRARQSKGRADPLRPRPHRQRHRGRRAGRARRLRRRPGRAGRSALVRGLVPDGLARERWAGCSTSPRVRSCPGHGEVVTRAFVEGQLADLSALAQLARRVRFDGGSVNDALPLSPFPATAARPALLRAFAQLAGEL